MSISIYSLQPCLTVEIGPDIQLRTWQDERIVLPNEGTHFGYVYGGFGQLKRCSGQYSGRYSDSAFDASETLLSAVVQQPFPLCKGMYFSLAEAAELAGENFTGIVISVRWRRFSSGESHTGRFELGGPVTGEGQLAYIDGGRTSLLVAPMFRGDPCLHMLYMPPGVDQTVHSHPSERVGLVISGQAYCIDDDRSYELAPGKIFHIPAARSHRFCTGQTPFQFVVFHPDSDSGFTHRDHPMLRRTMVGQVSAVNLPDIQTDIDKANL